MFGRRATAARIADALRVNHVNEAFDQAEANARTLGKAVAARIATEFLAGRIGRQGVQQRIELALHQLRSLPADQVPTSMCERIEDTLRKTIADGLRAAGIPGGESAP